MMDTATGFRRVADLLRRDGFVVVERGGWEHRSNGRTLTPKGFVNHHTATSERASTMAVLGLLDDGHSTLRGPLCNWSLDRDGVLYLHAAGAANHAGKGGWQGLVGNSTVIGLEAHHDGSEPVPEAQAAAAVALNRHCADVFGFPETMICEHREWAPGRKPDRAHVSGPEFRAAVRNYAPPPSSTEEILDMDKDELYRLVQKAVREIDTGHTYVDPRDGEERPFGELAFQLRTLVRRMHQILDEVQGFRAEWRASRGE